MKRYSSVIIALFLLSHINAHAQSPKLKQEQYDFLKWFVNYKHLAPLSDTTIAFLNEQMTVNDVKKVLSRSSNISRPDLIFITDQIKNTAAQTTLDTVMLPGEVFTRSLRNLSTYMYVSLPIFTRNGKMALIDFGYTCGITCGHEGIEVYIKTKQGQWKRSDKYLFPYVVF